MPLKCVVVALTVGRVEYKKLLRSTRSRLDGEIHQRLDQRGVVVGREPRILYGYLRPKPTGGGGNNTL